MEIKEFLNRANKWSCLGSGSQCYLVMYTIARVFNVQKVLEIGTHQGASAIAFANAILDNGDIPSIWTVDNWEGRPGVDKSYNSKETALEHMKIYEVDKYIEMIEGDSLTKIPEVFGKIKKVDLCFIDGNHSYDYILGDYNNCKDHCDLILFHDVYKHRILNIAKEEGWEVLSFPTRDREYRKDGQLIGISLCVKNSNKYNTKFMERGE